MVQHALVCGVVVGWALLVMPAGAAAQEEERPIEAVGSFSYLFADVEGSGFDSAGGPGFTGSFAFFLNDWLGVGGEVGYNNGGLDLPRIQGVTLPEIGFSQWTLLFGPRFRIAEREQFRFGAQAMVGIADGGTDVEFDEEELIIDVPGQGPVRFQLRAFEVHLSDTTFAALFGVHFDLRLHDRIFWRVVQPDILLTGYGDDTQAHFRITTGIGVDF